MRTDEAVVATIAVTLWGWLLLVLHRRHVVSGRHARQSVVDRLVAKGLSPVVCHKTWMIDLDVVEDPFPTKRGPIYRVVARDLDGREVRGLAQVEMAPWPRYGNGMLPPERTGRIDFAWDVKTTGQGPPPCLDTSTRDAELDGPAPR